MPDDREVPAWIRAARDKWRYTGDQRPTFAEIPGPGQESVWDYPRPPAIRPDGREVVVTLGGVEVARTRRALRVCETAAPPTWYLPPDDVARDLLERVPGRGSFCEWKGEATYWDVSAGGRSVERGAWSYAKPLPGFESVRDHLAFYAEPFVCSVDGERVRSQPGGFYGGWVTSDLAGPFKGEPGSQGW